MNRRMMLLYVCKLLVVCLRMCMFFLVFLVLFWFLFCYFVRVVLLKQHLAHTVSGGATSSPTGVF